MIRYARRRAGSCHTAIARPIAPNKTAAPLRSRACPACGGGDTRLIHKAAADPARSAPAVGVCNACMHFWAEGHVR